MPYGTSDPADPRQARNPTTTRCMVLLLAFATSLSAQETIRQASEARLWLNVPPDQAPLGAVQVSTGSATAAPRETDSALREHHIDVHFPIHWWSWSEITIRFTPTQDGFVNLLLIGPWAPEINGSLARQEILWDEITATGATLENGGFETMAENAPASWQSPWAPYLNPDSWPLAGAQAMAGKHLAATWHNRPLTQKLHFKVGREVTLQLHAKAATSPDFTPPKRLGNDTPAHRAVAYLKRGVNLGNGWEAPPDNSWGIHFTPADIDHIADQGFDHIRVPVAWHYYLKQGKKGFVISPDLLEKLEPVLRRAIDRKLHVILNWHHFNEFTTAPAANLGRFIGGWQAISSHFKSWPPGLFLELLNEPNGALTTETANPIYQKTIAAIRTIDPNRIIVVSPGNWGQVGELDKLRLPDNDERIIVTVHCYEPFHFTHQGANWVDFQDLRGIRYPGPPEQPFQIPPSLTANPGVRSFIEGYNSLQGEQNPCSARPILVTLDTARAWSLQFGRPIHLGEFGCHNVGDIASRKRYLHDVRTIAEARKIPWSLWEWKASFGYWDATKNQPIFRDCLFTTH